MKKLDEFTLGLIELADLHDIAYIKLYTRVLTYQQAMKKQIEHIPWNDLGFFNNLRELINNYYNAHGKMPDFEKALETIEKYVDKEQNEITET